jgi:hydantoinase/carbamoylase family amidase
VSFACEEGSRFGMSSIGSRAITGGLANNDLLRLKDRDGISLREALEAAGLSPESVQSLKREPGWFGAYLEAHIDQGPDLEDFGQPIGVVRVIAGVSRHRITFLGKQAHSGAARMGRRSDAMAAAAGAILIAEEEANARSDEVVATVGTIEALPGIVNVLPNQVWLGLEVRTLSSAIEDAFLRKLCTRITEQARARDVVVKWELVSKSGSVMLPQIMREALALACADAGAPVHEVASWALHDAAHMAQHGPVGMLLVRNQGKVSHQPGELVRVDDLALLGNVLHAALCRMTKAR